MRSRLTRVALLLLSAIAPVAMIGSVHPRAAAAQDGMDMSGTTGAELGMTGLDFDAARMSFFNKADVDGDFALSPDEMGQAMAHGGSHLFDGFDVDGDGLIGLDEYVQHGNDLFLSLDADADGVLSPMEM